MPIKPLVSKPCSGCGKEMIGSPGRIAPKVFCSLSCSASRIRGPWKDNPPLICKWCSILFLVKKPCFAKVRKFCSQACSTQGRERNYGVPPYKETGIERKVQEWLTELDISFRSQVRIGRYLPDFLISHVPLIIEADGDYWHSFPDRKEWDMKRDGLLASRGYTVLRLREHEINNNSESCKQQIQEAIDRFKEADVPAVLK